MRKMVAFAFAALLLAGCGGGDAPESTLPEECGDLACQIERLIGQLFPAPAEQEALDVFDRVQSAVESGGEEEARKLASDLLLLALDTELNDPPGPATAEEGRRRLADLLFEFVDAEVATTDDGDDGVIAKAPAGEDTTIITEEGTAGTAIEAEDNTQDLVIVIEQLTQEEQSRLPEGDCLPTGLDQKEGCYEFDRFPPGQFQDEVEVGVCQELPAQDEGFQLHRFDQAKQEEGVVPLPNAAFPAVDCSDFTVSWSAERSDLGRVANSTWRGLAAISSLFAEPLYAVDAGFGGSTLDFSRIGWAKSLNLDITRGDWQAAPPGSQLSIRPTVRVTHVPESTSATVEGTDVSFHVMGQGTVDGGDSAVAVTDENGQASVSWILGSSYGTSQLKASAGGDSTLFTATAADQLTACSPTSGGDNLTRGYYYPDFPGTALLRVDMFFAAGEAGDYTISLTARDSTFDGPVIGRAEATVALSDSIEDNRRAAFVFDSASVAQGSTVTFEMDKVSGPDGGLVFAVADDEGCPLVETTDTDPPRSSPRFGGRGVRATIYGISR